MAAFRVGVGPLVFVGISWDGVGSGFKDEVQVGKAYAHSIVAPGGTCCILILLTSRNCTLIRFGHEGFSMVGLE